MPYDDEDKSYIDAEEDSFLDAGNKFCDGVSTDDDDQFNDNEDQ